MSASFNRRGLMLVLSSPSGAGKTTLSRRLLEQDDGLWMSVSVTTRHQRPGEVPGTDYQFVTPDEFQAMVRDGALLEHARVFGHDYGTPRAAVEESLARGRDVLFDIDWQGAQQITQAAREDVVKVFILPPSTEELERRLKSRAQDSAEVVAGRMARAADEMTHWPEYDYVIVNDDAARATAQVAAILAAARLERARQRDLGDFVDRLIRR